MRRSKKFILVALVATLVLVGATATVAFAQSGQQSSAKTLVARVAQILGIEEPKVQNAFDQAQKEMQEEALDSRLKSAVEQGKMTQEQADNYKKWWQSKPATPELDAWQKAQPDVPLFGKGFGKGFGGRGGFGGLRGFGMRMW